jgi:aryl-alcohol dehydrogenase-like predicted oxidoreductase
VSLIPYSPLAGGVLTGKYRNGATPEGARFSAYINKGGRFTAMAQRFVSEKALASTERFHAIARDAGLDPVTMAVAWSKQHDFVASTIVGVTRVEHVAPILAAADLVLSDDVMKAVKGEIMYPMG